MCFWCVNVLLLLFVCVIVSFLEDKVKYVVATWGRKNAALSSKCTEFQTAEFHNYTVKG